MRSGLLSPAVWSEATAQRFTCCRAAQIASQLAKAPKMPDSPKITHPSAAEGSRASAAEHHENNLVVRSAALQQVMRLAEKVARHPAAVLIAGETGTGKEMIAHAIHNHSMRCNQQLIDVNCAAIPE